ncbi:hypothetical protein SHIRM173S_06067 [Streptomyces hirsutus]
MFQLPAQRWLSEPSVIFGPTLAVRRVSLPSTIQPYVTSSYLVKTENSLCRPRSLVPFTGRVMAAGLALRASSVTVVFFVTLSFGWARSISRIFLGSVTTVPFSTKVPLGTRSVATPFLKAEVNAEPSEATPRSSSHAPRALPSRPMAFTTTS